MKFAKYWFTKNQGVRANYIPVMFFDDPVFIEKKHNDRDWRQEGISHSLSKMLG